MRIARSCRFAVLLFVLALVMIACGGGDGDDTAEATQSPPQTQPTATATQAATTTPVATPVATPMNTATATPVATAAGTPTSTVAAVPVIDGEVMIFAAASLTEAFTQMKSDLEAANAGATITLNFAGSSALRTQLAEGAPADVFASADQANMSGAQEDGTIAGDPQIFVGNRLVVIVPADNQAGIETLADLGKPGIKLVLAQAQVPVGNYSRQVLEKMAQDPEFGDDFDDQVLANLVSEEANVKQVVTKIQLGEADAGIVYASEVTPAVRPDVNVIDIPDDFNVLAEYPIAVVAEAPNAESAAAFIDYVLSPAGQAILADYGFIAIVT